MPSLSAADLKRIESFGDNCELGFVLRRLGCEDGMLFRWSSIRPESLIASLRDDFAGLYIFDNLVAHRDKMVLDQRYGTAWHTEMVSRHADGRREFLIDAAGRRPIYAAEALKRGHLVEKLRQKFEFSDPVFVLKCNDTVSAATVEAVHYQLYRRVASPRFVLLEVRADPARAGEIDVCDRTLLRGYVSHFALYEDAENGDDASWHRILERALAHHAVSAPVEPVGFANIVLPFPNEPEPKLTQIVAGDLRAGMVRLFEGTEWCRLVDDDAYRLHAKSIGRGATALQWSSVHVPPHFTISLHAQCAIAASKPVLAVLTVAGLDGQSVQQSCVIRPERPMTIVLNGASGEAGPVSVRLEVEPLKTLMGDERAVIDVQPIICSPTLDQARIAA